MATIVTRSGKGAPLSHTEMDANWNNLNNDKAELASPALTGVPTAPTAAKGTDTTQLATTAFIHDEFIGKDYGNMYLGSGDSGSKTVATSENLSLGEYHYTDLTINTGQTVGVAGSSDQWLIIRCTGTFTMAGTATIDISGKGSLGGQTVEANGTDGVVSSAGGGAGVTLNKGGAGGDAVLFQLSTAGGVGGDSSPFEGGDGATLAAQIALSLHNSAVTAALIGGLSGAGGGASRIVSGSNGKGGQGGGGIIVIADIIDFPIGATIDVSGNNGSVSSTYGSGAGGGGAVILAAREWTDSAGTIDISGGTGGVSTYDGGDGGDGYTKLITL